MQTASPQDSSSAPADRGPSAATASGTTPTPTPEPEVLNATSAVRDVAAGRLRRQASKGLNDLGCARLRRLITRMYLPRPSSCGAASGWRGAAKIREGLRGGVPHSASVRDASPFDGGFVGRRSRSGGQGPRHFGPLSGVGRRGSRPSSAEATSSLRAEEHGSAPIGGLGGRRQQGGSGLRAVFRSDSGVERRSKDCTRRRGRPRRDLVLGLLRSHEQGRCPAPHRASGRCRRRHEAGQTQVQQFDHAVAGEHHIGRLPDRDGSGSASWACCNPVPPPGRR